MANKKQGPVMAIILIAVVVVVAFFIVRAISPRPPDAPPISEYIVCMEEGCPFRISLDEAEGITLMECPECGGVLDLEFPHP